MSAAVACVCGRKGGRYGRYNSIVYPMCHTNIPWRRSPQTIASPAVRQDKPSVYRPPYLARSSTKAIAAPFSASARIVVRYRIRQKGIYVGSFFFSRGLFSPAGVCMFASSLLIQFNRRRLDGGKQTAPKLARILRVVVCTYILPW